MALTIGIGRNVKGQPMDTREWEAFRSDVDAALHDRKLHPVFYGVGVGEYEGQREDSATWVIAEYSESQLTLIRLDLTRTARHFGQEAIALTVGETEFLG